MKNFPPLGGDTILNWCALAKFGPGEPSALTMPSDKRFNTFSVARCGSLSAAARVLQVSQPGLTAVIKQLEESFGTRLLVRLRTGVSLTSTGEELLRFANESLARLEEIEHRIKGLESDEVGSFVIGCHESWGAYFLP